MPACRLTSAPTPAATAIRRSSSRGTASPRSTINLKPRTPIVSGEAEEPEPAHEMLGPRRPARAVGARHGRRGHADTERPDAGDDMRVGGDRMPAHGVRAARQAPERRDDRSTVGVRRSREVDTAAVEDAHRVGQQSDVLVETQVNRGRRARELRAEMRRRRAERRVRRRRRRREQRDEHGGDERPHRCRDPASGER